MTDKRLGDGETVQGTMEVIIKDASLYVAAKNARQSNRIAGELLLERYGQINREGYDVAHDDEHTDGSLASAAAAYAYAGSLASPILRERMSEFFKAHSSDVMVTVKRLWPRSWLWEYWKPKDPRRDLVRAGALIIAEIERLDRQAERVKRNDQVMAENRAITEREGNG